jgi:hypothetical protein
VPVQSGRGRGRLLDVLDLTAQVGLAAVAAGSMRHDSYGGLLVAANASGSVDSRSWKKEIQVLVSTRHIGTLGQFVGHNSGSC